MEAQITQMKATLTVTIWNVDNFASPFVLICHWSYRRPLHSFAVVIFIQLLLMPRLWMVAPYCRLFPFTLLPRSTIIWAKK
jgi:hypothetical protein